jgi:hypothetical protein
MVRLLAAALLRPKASTTNILRIFLPLFSISNFLGLEGLICLSSICLECNITLQKSIVKFFEAALKSDNKICRYGVILGLGIIGRAKTDGIGAYAQKLVFDLDDGIHWKKEQNTSRLFILAARKMVELQVERRNVNESVFKYLKLKHNNPVNRVHVVKRNDNKNKILPMNLSTRVQVDKIGMSEEAAGRHATTNVNLHQKHTNKLFRNTVPDNAGTEIEHPEGNYSAVGPFVIGKAIFNL